MPNRLADETSPYLLQHADNPVDWHPWGEEALALAAESDRPILLSIGYSSCHWCHVMAHESFEDPEVAALMNRFFVNVKVDREERPDLDQIYQAAQALLTGRPGGWPLTLFLGADGIPFFGGTYFPKHPRHGLPGMMDLLPRVAGFYRERRDELGPHNAALLGELSRASPTRGEMGELGAAPLADAAAGLRQAFDPVYGGFGAAPKFPRPADLDFCLRRGEGGDEPGMRDMALFTLRRMAAGGIRDHLGGGFCRYSVDERWQIPHFEKMLYDNGPLLALYGDAFLVTGEALFKQVAEGIAGWAIGEMQAPEGGYYSSQDADSEGREGSYYCWTRDEVAGILSPEAFAVAAPYFGLDCPPNFDGEYWHVYAAETPEAIAAALGLATERVEQLIAAAAQRLLAARQSRPRPGRDEKILTSWNALMIKGMARTGRVFGRADWLASARRAADFIRVEMWREGRLRASYKDGQARLAGYLDDYAFLLDALLELMQGDFRSDDADFARELAEALLSRFEDPEAGGFYFTEHEHEALIHRPKPAHDGATPSGNGVAAFALQRLGHLLGEPRYLAAAERALRLFYREMARQPAAHTTLAGALEEYLEPPTIALVRGEAAPVAEWVARLAGHFLPHALVLALPRGVEPLPDSLDRPIKGAVNGWVCRGVKCMPATDSLDELLQACKIAGVD